MRKLEEGGHEESPVEKRGLQNSAKQIKSRKRVRDHGEVFTNPREVKAMCDLIPADVWDNIDSTFLEPACGNGNFLVEVMARKYNRCKNACDGLRALRSLTAIDIMPDNVLESRARLYKQFQERFPAAGYAILLSAASILAQNIICGDSLKIMKGWEEDEQIH